MSFPAIFFDGYYRVLSYKPSPENDLPLFGKTFMGADPMPLRDIDLSWESHRILNQRNTSSCVAHATATGMEILYKQRQNVQKNFNPYFMYALINGGYDDGAYISDAMSASMKYGICETDAFPSDKVYYKRSLTKEAYDNAARFKLDQAYRCTSFDQICQALNLGFVVNIGINVGDNFTSVDSEGIAPLARGVLGGHSMLACGLKNHPKYGWLIKVQNSWGSNFGIKGYCYLRKEAFGGRALDCFAFQGVLDDPKDPNKADDVPVVKTSMESDMSTTKYFYPENEIDDMKNNAISRGMAANDVTDLVSKYGPEVLSTISEGLRSNFSVSFIMEMIKKFGPNVLDFLLTMFSDIKMQANYQSENNLGLGSLSKEQVQEILKDQKMGGISTVLLKLVVKNILPKIVELYGQDILDAIVKTVTNAVEGIEE